MKPKAVILLSGGLDSAVTLYLAKQKCYECHCLILDYGQRHKKEIAHARKIAAASGSKFKVLNLKLPWKGSSLIGKNTALPAGRTIEEIKKSGIPSTYVPSRNTIFISMASSFAEAIGAETIFIGAHHEDSSGYPDCRKEYLEAFGRALELGTKAGIEGNLKLKFPLIEESKSQIIKIGESLAVPLNLTWSCYTGGAKPCMRCDSCILRAKGFKEAGINDPLTAHRGIPKASVTEIFSSIQGEGMLAGVRQIFVRFKKCNMECDFCDTRAASGGKEYSAGQLVREINAIDRNNGPHHSVSLTGGEPLMYTEFLKKLLPPLKESGFQIYLETNGTLPDDLRKIIDLIDIVAMDIKLPSATKTRPCWHHHLEFLKAASKKRVFVKAVVTADTSKIDIEEAIGLIKKVDSKIPFIIQPATPVKKFDMRIPENRLKEFVDLTLKSGIKDARVMPQMHKIWGVK